MNSDRKEHSAGGVIFENGLVLIIHMRTRDGKRAWTFPKGHLEPGETPRQAALREVGEETGWDCEIVAPLGTARYSFERGGGLVNKEVVWFLMRRVGGDGLPRTPEEVLDSRWLPLDEAGKLLTYPSDLELLNSLKKI